MLCLPGFSAEWTESLASGEPVISAQFANKAGIARRFAALTCRRGHSRLLAIRAVLIVVGVFNCVSRINAADDWVDFRQTGRFLVRSEFPIGDDGELSAFLRHPEDHEADIISTLGLKPSAEPIIINLFASRREFLHTIRIVAPDAASRRAVFVSTDTVGQIYCYRHASLVTDLRHELTHAILHSMLPFLPLWLDEGLAEYFETPPVERASGHPSQKRVTLSAKFGLTWHPNLAKLEAKNELTEVSLGNYREAWAWVHFLLHGPPQVTHLLQRYLLTIQAEQPPGPFSAHLRQVVPDPERALTSHLKSRK